MTAKSIHFPFTPNNWTIQVCIMSTWYKEVPRKKSSHPLKIINQCTISQGRWGPCVKVELHPGLVDKEWAGSEYGVMDWQSVCGMVCESFLPSSIIPTSLWGRECPQVETMETVSRNLRKMPGRRTPSMGLGSQRRTSPLLVSRRWQSQRAEFFPSA